MGKHIVLGLRTVLLLTVLDFSFAEDKMAYYKVGGELKLRPDVSDRISNILWKLNGDLIAEWVEKIVPLDYYGRFKDRTTLDITSGVLVMKNLDESDAGKYTVEINNKVHPQRFIGKAIEVVPKPDVWVQPLNCHSEMDSCTLNCEKANVAIEAAEPISYEWKEDDGRWEEKEKNITIKKIDTAQIKTFTCKMKNPVSEEESDPKDNVFYKEPPPPNLGLAVGIPVFLLILVVIIGLGVVYKKKHKRQDEGDSRPANGHGTRSPSDGILESSERVGLKETTEAPESA